MEDPEILWNIVLRHNIVAHKFLQDGFFTKIGGRA